MFHQVFIYDRPNSEEENCPIAQTDNVNLSARLEYCKDKVNNAQTKCELDPICGPEDLEQKIKLDDEKLPIPKEDKTCNEMLVLASSMMCGGKELTTNIQCKTNETKLNGKLDTEDFNEKLKLEGKLEPLFGQNENKSDFDSSALQLKDEDKNITVNKGEECKEINDLGLSNMCYSQQEQSIMYNITNCNNINVFGKKIKYSGAYCNNENVDNSNETILIKSDTPVQNISLGVSKHVNFDEQSLQLHEDITNTITSDIFVNIMNLNNHKLLNITYHNNINKEVSSHPFTKKTNSRASPSVEDDSASDWEEEYFNLTKKDLNKKCSKYINLIDSTSSEIKTPPSESTLMRRYGIKHMRVELHRLPDSQELQTLKGATTEIRENDSNGMLFRSNNECGKIKISSNTTIHGHISPRKGKLNNEQISPHLNNDSKIPFKPCNVAEKNNNKKREIVRDYKCDYCIKCYADKYTVKKHVRRKHPNKYALFLEQQKKVREVKKKAENEEQTIMCNNCCELFKSKKHLYAHRRTLCYGYRPTPSFQCDFCGKLFPSKAKLQNHRNGHTNAKPFKCVACDQHFTSTSGRIMHFKSVHQNIKQKTYLCSYCGIIHKSLQHILSHEELHRLPESVETPTPFKCAQCGKGYISKFTLSRHIRDHKSIMKKCPQCQKLFDSELLLKIHLKNVHNIRKEYKCNVCDKVYESKSSLTYHNRVHSSALPFSCEICDKCFRTRSHIVQHMITHSTERTLSCTKCGDRFKRKTHLNQHMSAIHGHGRNK